jgi:hypothetical protein
VGSAGSVASLLTLASVHNPNTNPTGRPAIYRSTGVQLQPVTSVWAAGWAGRSPSNNTQDSLIAVYGGLP